ncbi:MAG: LysR family transcriptional regulator [Magnetococcales bacterium]|nr:LysR family transcriptional regulator [Magnetococcales bacterium]
MDRLALMESFVRVVESGSFAEAARKGRVSRAAVSKHVETLEEYLGVHLLNRTTRRMHLTVEGEVFFRRCRAILEEVTEAEQEATQLHAAPRGQLRVNAPMSFGVHHLAPAAAAFLSEYPGIEMELVLNDRIVDLVEEGFDVGVRIGVLEDSTLMVRRLAWAQLVLCASPEYVARRGIPAQPEDLTTHACLIYSYTQSPNLWRFRQGDATFTVRVAGPLCANNGDVLRVAALAGLGVAILPVFLVSRELDAGTLIPLLPAYTLPCLGIYAVTPSNRHLSAKVRRLIDFLASRFGSQTNGSRFGRSD